MKIRRKSVLLFGIKVIVLAALVIYAFRGLQLDDEFAVPMAGSAAASRLIAGTAGARGTATFQFSTTDGRTIPLVEGTRLRLVDPIPAGPQSAGPSPRALETTASARLAANAEPLRIRAQTANDETVLLSTRDVAGPEPALDRLPGIRSTLSGLHRGWFLASIAIFGPALFLMVPRWVLLLRASGARVPFWIAARLTYMCHFLNTFMPGGTGGDIVKAVFVAHHSDRKAEAATMVLIDRVVGMVGLLFLAGVVVVFNYRRLHGVALPIGLLSLSISVGALLFYSQTVRKLVHYDALLARLPKADWLVRVDAALYGLRSKKTVLLGAFGMTLVLQLLEVTGIWCAGQALGLHRAEASHYLVFVPIGYLANAIPLSFGGLGLMEGAYVKLFGDAGVATASQAFMLGVLARVAATAWSLPGALSALFPPKLPAAVHNEPELPRQARAS